MKKLFLFFIFSYISTFANNTILPSEIIKVNGVIKDMVLNKNKLIIGTNNGVLQEYDLELKRFSKLISLKKIKDFMGDKIPATVFSVDKIKNTYLLLSNSDFSGYMDLWIHENNTTKQLISAKDEKTIVKARFINTQQILLAHLGNEVSLFDIKTKKELYSIQLNASKFSDFSLNELKSKAVFSNESGELYILNTKNIKVTKRLNTKNVDNVYKVDYKKNFITAAGQDKRAAIYNIKKDTGTYIKSTFLVYATALSPSSKLSAFSMGEENYINIYNTTNMKKLAILKGHNSTLNTIIFKNENIIFSSSDDENIIQWNINKKE